ncbi:MAG: cation diffusion facilitator family transporter [Desulfurococcales archaeon]|nr:cation diffusion facilitator family transporter [Desulfurococcales archaeon]
MKASRNSENKGWYLLYVSFLPLFLAMLTRILIGLWYDTPVLIVEGYHALVDTVISGTILVTVYIVRSRYAMKFQYGLYRLEDITAFTVAILILATLGLSLRGIWIPPSGNLFIIATGQSITIPLLLSVMYAKKRAGELLNSPSLIADAAHMTVDVVESSAVVLGLALFYFTHMITLYYVAAVAALLGLLIAAYEAGYDSLKSLLDLPRDKELLKKIKDAIESCEEDIEVTDVRVRWAGPVVFAEALLRMRPLKTIDEAGETINRLEKCVKANIMGIKDILFRLEPSIRSYYKIVVPADETSQTALISPHFAKSKYYYIIEANNKKIISKAFIENPFLKPREKPCKATWKDATSLLLGARIAEYFHDKGVTDVIVTNIGEIAFALFLRHEIVVWKGIENDTLNSIVQKFVNQELKRLKEPTSEASWEKHVV